MDLASLLHEDAATCAVTTLHVTRTVWERARGLLWRPLLMPGEGLLLAHCAAIHTCGMPGPLDIAFLDADLVVRRCVPALRPFRHAACAGARFTLELPVGGLALGAIEVGRRLRLGPAPGAA